MKFKDFLSSELVEQEMRYRALEIAKNVHTELARISFLEMLSVMNSSNPAKKEVQELESKLNELTTEVGAFIQKYIPDVSDAEADDRDEEESEKPPVKKKSKESKESDEEEK